MQASWCIWMRFGFDPNRHDLADIPPPIGLWCRLTGRTASSRNYDVSTQRIKAFPSPILSGRVGLEEDRQVTQRRLMADRL